MPPKKRIFRTFLPPREIEIAARLREARENLRLSQGEFADQVSITRERLASYEDARAPLPALVALHVCRQFVISEQWLAQGNTRKAVRIGDKVLLPADTFPRGGTRLCMDLLNDRVSDDLPPRIRFSEAFDKFLARRYERLKRRSMGYPRIVVSARDTVQTLQNCLRFLEDHWIKYSPSQESSKRLIVGLLRAGWVLYDELCRHAPYQTDAPFEKVLAQVAKNPLDYHWAEAVKLHEESATESRILGAIRSAAEHGLAPEPPDKKKMLTDAATSDNLSSVKSPLENLRARLNRITSTKGNMQDLADYLKAPYTSVSRWLSGKREPGGETALKMLNWVEQQERQ